MSNTNHDFETLNDNWEFDVEVFKEWVCSFGGIKKTSRLYRGLIEEINTVSDIDEWIRCFNGDLNEIKNASIDYLVHRLECAV